LAENTAFFSTKVGNTTFRDFVKDQGDTTLRDLTHDLIKNPILVVNAYDVGEGFFNTQILFTEGSLSGEYRVDIRFRRNVIATTKFELRKP